MVLTPTCQASDLRPDRPAAVRTHLTTAAKREVLIAMRAYNSSSSRRPSCPRRFEPSPARRTGCWHCRRQSIVVVGM